MICSHCNQEVNDTLEYCPHCGRKIQHIKKKNYQNSTADKKDEKKKTNNNIKWIVILLLLLLVFRTLSLVVRRKPANREPENIDSSEPVNSSADGTTGSSGTTADTGTTSDKETTSQIDIDDEVIETVAIEANIPADAVTFGGHSYYIFDNNCEDWNEAAAYCEKSGGYLAVINSSEENEFLYDYMIDIGFDEVFMGYTDQYVEGRWEWIDGRSSSFEDWGINDEGSQEPNADSVYENYAHMNSAMHNGHWNDKRFGKTSSCYFCEWDMISYLGEKKKRTVVKDGVPMKNDSSDNSSTIMTLNQDEEIRVLFCLTKDDGKQWFYVQHKTGVIGYIEAESLEVTE